MALEAHRDGCAATVPEAALARRISARRQDHPAACRAGLGRHHPVRPLRAAPGARRRQGRDRGAAGAQGVALAPWRARPPWSAAARRCRRSMCIVRWRACRCACKTELVSVPAEIPYLRASEQRIARWRERIEACRRRASPSPGRGAPPTSTTATGRLRSANSSRCWRRPTWASSASSASCAPADAERLAREPRIAHLGGELADFADTAAVLALCDLTVCVDTSVAHLAAAMGRPVFVLHLRSSRIGAGPRTANSAPGIRRRGCSASRFPATGTSF